MSREGWSYTEFVLDIGLSEQDVLDSVLCFSVHGIISRYGYMKIIILTKKPCWSWKKRRLVNIR
jgi:hypothetical protein